MTDIEITKLCAEAMGLEIVHQLPDYDHICVLDGGVTSLYTPLHDDAQAMALVKKFALKISPLYPLSVPVEWEVQEYHVEETPLSGVLTVVAGKTDLNRAIVECVAKMQKAKP